MAQLYADESFHGPIVRHLRALGHDVLTAHDDGRSNVHQTKQEIRKLLKDGAAEYIGNGGEPCP